MHSLWLHHLLCRRWVHGFPIVVCKLLCKAQKQQPKAYVLQAMACMTHKHLFCLL